MSTKVAPLVNLGISLINQLKGKPKITKDILLQYLQKTAATDNVEELEAHIQKLAILAKADKDESFHTTLEKIISQEEARKWKNILGYIGAGSLGIDWVGLPIINAISLWLNGIFGLTIPPVPHMDMSDSIMIISTLAGMALLNNKDKYSNDDVDIIAPELLSHIDINSIKGHK